MTETPTPTDSYLDYVKKVNSDRLISHLNGVGASIVQAYPTAEVQSWTIQNYEAKAVVALADGEDVPTLAQLEAAAPFLTEVCRVQFGEVDPEERVDQIIDKARLVAANAELWAALSAFVNGLRARVQKAIEESTSEAQCHQILHEGFTELEEFRSLYQI